MRGSRTLQWWGSTSSFQARASYTHIGFALIRLEYKTRAFTTAQMLPAVFWSMMCLDCSGDDLRRVSEWTRDISLQSDFHTAFREPQRVEFLCDGKKLRCVAHYSNRVQTYMAKRVEFRFQKMEVGKIFMTLQFLKQYLDYSLTKTLKIHVTTNERLGVVFFQGPPFGYQTIVDSFFVVYDLIGTEAIVPKRLSIFESMRLSSPRKRRSSASGSSGRKSAWISPRRVVPVNGEGDSCCLVENISPEIPRYNPPELKKK